MRGIIPGILMISLALCGCQPARHAPGLGPLPEPMLATRQPPPPTRGIRPPRPAPRVQPAPTHDYTTHNTREWLPASGIRRGSWQTIVVHHSASSKATPQSMHDYHLKEKGWANGLGYHFVIGNGVNYPDGKVYVGPRWKRQIPGAHCSTSHGRYLGQQRPGGYFNDHGIGICLIGNFENSHPTARQLASLRTLITFLCQETGISPDNIHGHGEVTHRTACPGRMLNMDEVRRSARVSVAASK
ncbi:MAG: N-acetylmuramoyl-L-alanine amidase [Planctomycetota bacterium]